MQAHVAQEEDDVPTKVLPCQLPPKELNPGSFTFPCTIRSLNFYAMADLGASVNVIPKSMFEHLKLANLKKTDMLFEMADMTKWVPLGIVENVIVKINKFLFPPDFVVIDMLNTRNETMILGRPFLAIIHAEIDVFNKEISLEIRNDRITFDMDKEIYNFMTPVGKVGHTNVSVLVKKSLLKSWPIDCFREELVKDPRSRNYKWVFDLEIDQLANEYELGIGKKGHMLDDIWENYKKVQGDNTYWWHDHGLEENERQEIGLDIEEYDPPEVHVETFEGNDPKRIGHRREDPKKDVKRLESNLKTYYNCLEKFLLSRDKDQRKYWRTKNTYEEIIVNGDAPVIASASTEGPIPPKNFEQKLARNNELKAKSTLLLAIPDEHLLKFH
ncbi:putative reverse transcriptase domain-containing protein [Tanacetum coccineum]